MEFKNEHRKRKLPKKTKIIKFKTRTDKYAEEKSDFFSTLFLFFWFSFNRCRHHPPHPTIRNVKRRMLNSQSFNWKLWAPTTNWGWFLFSGIFSSVRAKHGVPPMELSAEVRLLSFGPLSSFLFCMFPSCSRQPIERTFVKMCTYAQQWADQLLAENRFQHRCQPCEYWISITDIETLVTGMVSTAKQQQPFINQKTLTIKQIINRHSRP